MPRAPLHYRVCKPSEPRAGHVPHRESVEFVAVAAAPFPAVAQLKIADVADATVTFCHISPEW